MTDHNNRRACFSNNNGSLCLTNIVIIYMLTSFYFNNIDISTAKYLNNICYDLYFNNLISTFCNIAVLPIYIIKGNSSDIQNVYGGDIENLLNISNCKTSELKISSVYNFTEYHYNSFFVLLTNYDENNLQIIINKINITPTKLNNKEIDAVENIIPKDWCLNILEYSDIYASKDFTLLKRMNDSIYYCLFISKNKSKMFVIYIDCL